MSNANVTDVMRIAVRQDGYKESPAGSNKTKFGKAMGMNGVPWCAEYLFWCGEQASGTNPIYKSANAAYIQDLTVSKLGGTWVMKKTASNTTKKAGLAKAKFGDIVDFDFGKNNLYRQHTAFCLGTSGEYYITIEGNTSASSAGSQSNGGCVAIRTRHYKQVCSIVRPKYGTSKKYAPTTSYLGAKAVLPKRGWFKKGDSGNSVSTLQQELNWATGEKLVIDGVFGNYTLAAVVLFQYYNGLVPDGEFGAKSLAKMNALIDASKKQTTVSEATVAPQKNETAKVEEVVTEANKTEISATTTTKLTKAEKIWAKAKECAYAYGTKASKYTYPGGKPKAEYKTALDKAYPDRSKWGARPKKGVSCDVFVGTVIRASGVDTNWPRGLDEIEDYCKKNTKKWKKINAPAQADMKKGDIIYQIYNSGAGHVCIFNGGKRVANAHYVKKTYPVIQAFSSIVKAKSGCKKFYVYRIKE